MITLTSVSKKEFSFSYAKARQHPIPAMKAMHLKDYLNAFKCTAPKINVFKPLFVLNKLYILSYMVKIEGLCLSTVK